MNFHGKSNPGSAASRHEALADFVVTECQKRLRAYTEQPRDVLEHYNAEIEVLSGGYAYRQLFELIQNAADAILEENSGRGRVHVLLSEERLVAANTGAPLDEDGIVALLNARSSSKRGSQIGRFGIGFKSLLTLGAQVDIVSESIGLRFQPAECRARIREHLGLPSDTPAPGMRLASVIDPASRGNSPWQFSWATTVVTASVDDLSTVLRLEKEVASFPAEFILFLDADIELTLEIAGGAVRHISRRAEGHWTVLRDGEVETRWRVFERQVNIDDPDAKGDAGEIQARRSVPISWAVPVGQRPSAGRFWAFFPTETPSRTIGILNAPWKLNSDRTNLIRGPWNSTLMREAGSVIVESMPLITDASAPVGALEAMPVKLDRQDDIAEPLVSRLWEGIASSAVFPDANGEFRRAHELMRCPVEDLEAATAWMVLASQSARSAVLHPQATLNSHQLQSIASEYARLGEGAQVLKQLPVREWLVQIATPVPSHNRNLIRLLARLTELPLSWSWSLRTMPILLASDGHLVSAEEAILSKDGSAPAGFRAISQEIAADQRIRRILIDNLAVKEFRSASWPEILEESLSRAAGTTDEHLWLQFWENACKAPPDAARALLEQSTETLCYRNRKGGWLTRDRLLVVEEQDTGIPDRTLLDLTFHEPHRSLLPAETFELFPPIGWSEIDPEAERPRELTDYLQSVDQLGWRKMEPGPQRAKLGILQEKHIEMPSGWTLLPHLPKSIAAGLTARLLASMSTNVMTRRPILYGHLTRRDRYTDRSAPHPALHWLYHHGRIAVGPEAILLRFVPRSVAVPLAQIGCPGFEELSTFQDWLSVSYDLPVVAEWSPAIWGNQTRREFWTAIFNWMAETSTLQPSEMRVAWELAAADGEVPRVVRSSTGLLPLDQVFVTDDQTLVSGEDRDGGVVVLSGVAAGLWVSAGALPLAQNLQNHFTQLGRPQPLRDLFPELHLLKLGREHRVRLQRADAVWVQDLEQIAGTLRRQPLMSRDATGLLLIDRGRFEALSWREGLETVLSAIFGPSDLDLNDAIAAMEGGRMEAARARVREAEGVPAKLLAAVGGDIHSLLSALPKSVQEVAGAKRSPEELADLALAVLGPTALSRLTETLQSIGLDPPGRWGSQQAIDFVLSMGFPLEFAASAAGNREAQLSVSGPVHLPKLHDYQESILSDLESLLASGEGRRRAVISLPTGAGKTRVTAEAVVRLVLKARGKRTALWIAQTDELCEQAVQGFRQLWVNVGAPGEDLRIIRLWGGQRNPVPPEGAEPVVVVASIQTLNSRSGANDLRWLSRPGIVVIDECHHAIAPSYTDLLRWLDVQTGTESERATEPPVLGLSATPWRGYNEEESERLAARFDRRWLPAEQATLHEKLKANGILAELNYGPISYDKPVSLSPAEIRHLDQYGELPEDLVARMGNDPARNKLIVDAVLASNAESILLFANSVAHAQRLAATLHLRGCTAAAVSGGTDELARQHFVRRFRHKELRVICNHSVLTTGFDAPKADMILISRPVFSPVRYMQMVGRGLRGPANGGTQTCRIVTVEDNILNYQDKLAFHFCRQYFR